MPDSTLQWSVHPDPNNPHRVARTLKDGNSVAWRVVYDRASDSEWITSRGSETPLLKVDYANGLLPSHWQSDSHLNCSHTYNQVYQLTRRECQRGLIESFAYNDRTGQRTGRKTCQRSPIQYLYDGKVDFPREIVLSSGNFFNNTSSVKKWQSL